MSFRLRPWWGWRSDPPPCPVDGAPHTTCTSPDYAGGVLTVAVRTPRTLAATRQRSEPPPPVATVSPPFTTATYRRPTKKKGTP
jgi:hypothetical protein